MTNTSATLQSASLHFREGNSDKVYHAAIEPKGEGYIVTFAYGRRGNTLNTGTKTNQPVSLAEATKILGKLITSKLAKGYQYRNASAGEAKPYHQTRDEGRNSASAANASTPSSSLMFHDCCSTNVTAFRKNTMVEDSWFANRAMTLTTSIAGDCSSLSPMQSAMPLNKSPSMSSSMAKQ